MPDAGTEARDPPGFDIALVRIPGFESRHECTQPLEQRTVGAQLFGVVDDRVGRQVSCQILVQMMRTEDEVGRVSQKLIPREAYVVAQPAQREKQRARHA